MMHKILLEVTCMITGVFLMKRLIGFALLCIAFGMFLIMVLPFAAWIEFAFLIGLSVLGYALFCK